MENPHLNNDIHIDHVKEHVKNRSDSDSGQESQKTYFADSMGIIRSLCKISHVLSLLKDKVQTNNSAHKKGIFFAK